ncbi:MAG: electron transfer flavoprotein subunit alpha/FixB family protein [Candidatus Kariarchaeaceae archaeon]|jgi:electron transfer flavoprotein alpha subunit
MGKNNNKWQGVAVLIEQTDGVAENISWELLGKSRELANDAKQDLIAIVLAKDAKPIGQEAIARGADKAICASHDLLDHYKWETYSKVCTKILEDHKPSMWIVGATHNGRDLAGRIAVRMNTGLTADVVRLEVKDGLLLGAVPGFGGSILAIIKCEEKRPQIATVRPGIFAAIEPDSSRKGKLVEFKVKLDPNEVTTKLIETIKVEGIDISKAKRMVAAGRGVGSDLSQIKELAEMLDAAIGVTRPLCDVGLLPRDHQVGSTGVTVKPKITLNFGISGATHYVSGIQDSETVVSVNLDSEAIIFDHSDYIVEGDVNEILPELLEILKAKLLVEAK